MGQTKESWKLVEEKSVPRGRLLGTEIHEKSQPQPFCPHQISNQDTMKFITALTLSSIFAGASAFSAVAPSNVGSTQPVDKSLKGIDSAEGVFDPTSGDNAALTRNNKDEVWVPQVRNMIH